MLANRFEQPLIVNVALTGAVSDAAKNPNVPVTTPEIARQALASHLAGAAITHIHVRDAAQKPSTDPELFAQVFSSLRADPAARDLILCATTSGRHGQSFEQRTAVLELPPDIRPDMASLTLGSLNFLTGASVNDHDTVRRLCEKMLKQGVKPELEVFDLGMAVFMTKLVDEGLLVAPFYVNVLLGNPSSAQVDAAQFGLLQSVMPAGATIAVAGIGRYQLQANMLAIAVADGVRVGLEDNLWMDARRTPATNPGLVARLAGIAEMAQRPLMPAADLRRRLGLADRG